jgi:ferredoxin-NADP reductase
MFIGSLILREIRREASNASTFVFEKPRAAWLAGQHFMFVKPHFPFDLRGITRVFTIASAPEDDELCFTTRYFDTASSSFKKALFQMKPGERLWAYGPSPLFDYFRALAPGKDYVFLAGGVGITPVMATLRHYASVAASISAVLLYANRDSEVIFRGEIDVLQSALRSFTATYITSPQHIDASIIARAAHQYDAPQYIVSGSNRFVHGMVAVLRDELRVQKQDIISDRFRYIPLSGGGC